MKSLRHSRLWTALLALPLFLSLLSGCFKSEQDRARSALEKQGYKITAEEFVDRAGVFGTVENTKPFLVAGIDINSRNEKGETALMKASFWGNIELIRFLVEYAPPQSGRAGGKRTGANIWLKDLQGETALHQAARAIHSDVVIYLISLEARVNARNNKGETPLHKAAMEGRAGNISSLVKNGANINALDNQGRTPLHVVYGRDSFEVVKALVSMGANVNVRDKKGKTPMATAVHTSEMIRYFLEQGTDIHAKDPSGSGIAVDIFLSGDHKLLRKMMGRGLDINVKNKAGETPLMQLMAFYNQKFSPFAGYVRKQDRKKGEVRNSISRILDDIIETMKFLVNLGVKLDADKAGRTPLMEAMWTGDMKLVQQLVARGVPVNAKDNEGRTALSEARRFYWDDIERFLVSKGADK